jgi:hypothetical protein
MLNKSIYLALCVLLIGCNHAMNNTLYITIDEKCDKSKCFDKEYFIISQKCITNTLPTNGIKYKTIYKFRGAIVPFVVTNDNEYQYLEVLSVTKIPYFQTEREYRLFCNPGFERTTYLPDKIIFKRKENIKGFLFLIYNNYDKTIRIFPRDLTPISYSSIRKVFNKEEDESVKTVNLPDPFSLPVANKDILARLDSGGG